MSQDDLPFTETENPSSKAVSSKPAKPVRGLAQLQRAFDELVAILLMDDQVEDSVKAALLSLRARTTGTSTDSGWVKR